MDSDLIFWIVAGGVALVVGFVVWSMCVLAGREDKGIRMIFRQHGNL